jgi:hypothetical protein
MQNKWLLQATAKGTTVYQTELQIQTVSLTSAAQCLKGQALHFKNIHLH